MSDTDLHMSVTDPKPAATSIQDALEALGKFRETRVFSGDLIGNQMLATIRSALEHAASEAEARDRERELIFDHGFIAGGIALRQEQLGMRVEDKNPHRLPAPPKGSP